MTKCVDLEDHSPEAEEITQVLRDLILKIFCANFEAGEAVGPHRRINILHLEIFLASFLAEVVFLLRAAVPRDREDQPVIILRMIAMKKIFMKKNRQLPM